MANLIDLSVILLIIHNLRAEICTQKICEYQFDVRESRSMMYRPDMDHAYQVKVNNNGALELQPTSFHR